MGVYVETLNTELRKCGMKVWAEFVWLRIASSDSLLLTLMNLWVPYKAGNFLSS
jgi:hypothetical protein